MVGGTAIDEAEDLNFVMPMYNLIEYSSNYSETTEILWFYSKDEATNLNANIANIVQPAPNAANGILKNATIAVPLKYASNFWRSLEMQLINCKVELKIKWTKYCVLPAPGNDNVNGNVNDDVSGNNIIFTIKNTNLYVPVVTLSARENQKLSKLLSKGFETPVY